MAMSNFTPIQVPLINGVAPSFAHIETTIAGLSFTGGFKSIKYSRKRNREQVRSNSPDPVAQSLGENEYAASAVIYIAWLRALKRTIINTLGKGYGDQAFNVKVTYTVPGFDTAIDVIQGAHLDATNMDHSAGTAALTTEIDLQPLKILLDGDDDLAVPLQAPTQ